MISSLKLPTRGESKITAATQTFHTRSAA